jgi:hypothetical protein
MLCLPSIVRLVKVGMLRRHVIAQIQCVFPSVGVIPVRRWPGIATLLAELFSTSARAITSIVLIEQLPFFEGMLL